MSAGLYPTISELIADLEALRREHGDLPVFARDVATDYFVAADAEIDHVVPAGRRHYWRFAEPRESNIKAVTIR